MRYRRLYAIAKWRLDLRSDNKIKSFFGSSERHLIFGGVMRIACRSHSDTRNLHSGSIQKVVMSYSLLPWRDSRYFWWVHLARWLTKCFLRCSFHDSQVGIRGTDAQFQRWRECASACSTFSPKTMPLTILTVLCTTYYILNIAVSASAVLDKSGLHSSDFHDAHLSSLNVEFTDTDE